MAPWSPFECPIGHQLHLAVDDEAGGLLLRDLRGPPDLPRVGVVHAPEVGEGEHGDAGLDAEGPRRGGREQSDLGQLLGVGVHVDGAVGEEERPLGRRTR
jgi:hypothetical protein